MGLQFNSNGQPTPSLFELGQELLGLSSHFNGGRGNWDVVSIPFTNFYRVVCFLFHGKYGCGLWYTWALTDTWKQLLWVQILRGTSTSQSFYSLRMTMATTTSTSRVVPTAPKAHVHDPIIVATYGHPQTPHLFYLFIYLFISLFICLFLSSHPSSIF